MPTCHIKLSQSQHKSAGICYTISDVFSYSSHQSRLSSRMDLRILTIAIIPQMINTMGIQKRMIQSFILCRLLSFLHILFHAGFYLLLTFQRQLRVHRGRRRIPAGPQNGSPVDSMVRIKPMILDSHNRLQIDIRQFR